MLDGTRLKQSWFTALDDAQSNFRQLLTSFASPDWKRVAIPPDPALRSRKGKGRALAVPEFTDVIIHRKVLKSGENVYRAVLEVATDDTVSSLDSWKSVLATPELRKEWDPAVESAQLLEMFDQATRISKINFTLGWPVNPRDAVMISRTFNDATTLIDISTSLPRSADEPVYLRPSPPYVRSDVALFAWCIQFVARNQTGESSLKPTGTTSGKLRITCFWQHDLKLVFNFASGSSLPQQLCAMTVGLFKSVITRGTRIPLLTGYGNGVSIERVRFEIDREALTLDYSIVPEEEEQTQHLAEQGLEELHAIREHRRLTRAIECSLPSSEGWDIQITARASSEHVAQLPWTARAIRNAQSSPESASSDAGKLLFNVKHAPLPDGYSDSVLKVRIVIELSGPSSGIRLNGIPQSIEEPLDRDSSTYFISEQMLQDAASITDLSFHTQSSVNTIVTSTSKSSTIPERPQVTRALTDRTAAIEKSVLSRVKRSYIYFSSLLQEPEAKWRRTTESRGVTIAQLNSIDPTLVVYRAEATFVGLGLWDLYAAIVTPGARAYWDKLYDDAVLLEDVNELTELWHYKTKAAWPTTGREAVVFKTVYKSPATIHVFSFSADDPNLFPQIPPVDPSIIRTQIDLQGWAIEGLSPTTTLVTLLEQSDPKGWSNKAAVPQHMVTAVAGVGEFAIKCGGPPVATRLDGAKAHEIRYDHERGTFRMWYEGSSSRRSSSSVEKSGQTVLSSSSTPTIECEIRCDLDNWASSLDIVVDPPPQSISCLRRHRLSSGGGGLWLTVSHDAVLAGDERLHVLVRRGPSGALKDKGLVMVNGAKVEVDVEELPEREMKNLAKQKRVKPTRIPLDQPPVLGVIRRRKAEWDADGNDYDTPDVGTDRPLTTGVTITSPKFATSISNFFNFAVEKAATTTQHAVAAISPSSVTELVPSASKPPVQYAMEALACLQSLHSRPSTDGWILIGEKDFPVYRKAIPEISPIIPVHKGEKVIEGVSAEEVASVLTSYDCRKQWDTRYDSAHIFEGYGSEVHTSFVVMKGGFPFRDRGFFLASLIARESPSANPSRRSNGDSENSGEARTPIFCVSASFSPNSVASFSPSKYNTYSLPIGRVYVDGWILETLDPYAAENYAIPSTRCTRVVAVDYAGSIPAAVNLMINAMLPKSILAVATYMKDLSPPPFSRLPAAGILLSHTDEDQPSVGWTLRRRDHSRSLLTTRYNPVDRTYCSMMLLDGSRTFMSPSTERTPRSIGHTFSPLRSSPESTRPSRAGSISSNVPPFDSSSLKGANNATYDRSRSRDPVRASPVFTTRGEVRHATDLLLSEVVVDSKLYPDGYVVELQSYIAKSRAAITLSSCTDTFPGSSLLPVTCTAHTLPPSPLHSMGLNIDRPARHLLKFTLSTAQYQMSTIQDPLTGEIRTAPPKPQWFSDLEEGRAVVQIVIKPPANGPSGKTSVTFNGDAVQLLSEKEALTSLGRDELLDSRFSKMDLISGPSADAEHFPEEYEHPAARAGDLLDSSVEAAPSTETPELADADSKTVASEIVEDVKHSEPEPESGGGDRQSVDVSGNTFLRFFNTYPNTLFRFPSLSSRRSSSAVDQPSNADSSTKLGGADLREDTTMTAEVAETRRAIVGARAGPPTYPLWTVVIVALIAFLIGSLLRSLLSPADFIYVVTDRKEIDAGGTGWREIKRLLEVKYIAGGWDFQIAVVRRH